MEQTLLMKGGSLMLKVLFALSLAALIALSGAASRAAATDVSATNTVTQQLEDDGKLNSDMKEELEMWNRLENSSGADTASPSAPATTASAAQDQYKELPDTDGKVVAPAETTEATGLPETNGNGSVLPLMLGSGALLVAGGLLARRLIR